MTPDRHPWRRWPRWKWELYRTNQLEGIERFGEPWATRVGRPAVKMADWHLARLEGAA